MKNIIIVLVICVISYFAYQHFISGSGRSITTDGHEIIIKCGDNKFIAETVRDYNENLRVFGVNKNDDPLILRSDTTPELKSISIICPSRPKTMER